MSIHVAGPQGYRSFGNDCYVGVLRSRLARIWPDQPVDFGRVDALPFSPEAHRAGVLGGGGILYDYVYPGGEDNLRHFLRYPAAMQWFGKPTFGLGLGVQGVLGPEALAPYRATIESMKLCTVRDRQSAETLRECGVATPVLESADLGYLIEFDRRPLPTRQQARPLLGVVASQPERGVIHPDFNGFEERTLRALETLDNRFEFRFLSFHPPTDDWLGAAWSKPARRSTYTPVAGLDVGGFMSELAGVDLLLTSRYHGVVMAASWGMPFLALGAPGEKVQRECLALGYPAFRSYAANVSDLVSAVDEVWSERVWFEERLKSASARRSSLARRSIEALQARAESESAAADSNSLLEAASGPGRTLVVWAAPADFWDEASPLLSSLGRFDCIAGSDAKIQHRGISTRFHLPPPGIMNWGAFPEPLQRQLDGVYETVIVCHPGGEAPIVRHLAEIAGHASRPEGRNDRLQLSLWTHVVSSIEPPERNDAQVETGSVAGASA